MSRSRREESGPRSARTPEERERARLEREARRTGKPAPAPAASPARPAPRQAPQAEHAQPQSTLRRQPRAAEPAKRPARAQRPRPALPGRPAPREDRPRPARAVGAPAPAPPRTDAVRRIQPKPPAPPPAPAGVLDDETDRPIGIRRVRRPARPIVTPPGDRPGGPARRRRSVGGRLLGLLALAILAVLVVGALLLFQPFGSAEGDQVKVTIPAGAGAREIGDVLADANVVDSGLFFSIRATLSGKRDGLRSGDHTLREGMTYGKAIDELTKREDIVRPATLNVTIPEGRSRREIAPIAKEKGLRGDYLDASKRFRGALDPFRYGAPPGTRSLEGFLFPATYELKVGARARDLVERQLDAFAENFAKVDLRRARRRNLTGYDVLIVASMVEREARVARERPLIAAVIYNRLKDGEPLGIDATTRYVLNKPSGALTQSDLAIDSPYNTRKRAGLPPTPIGNPGLSSIRAAAKPANVGYRYFVVKPGTCGEHAFSDTIAEFERDSQRYNQARAEAGNKSPTTC